VFGIDGAAFGSRNASSVVDQFGSSSMRRTDRLKSEASHRPDVIQKILTHLGLGQDSDPQNRSPPADLTDEQTTLF